MANTISQFLDNLKVQIQTQFSEISVAVKGQNPNQQDIKNNITKVPAIFLAIEKFEEIPSLTTNQRVKLQVNLTLIVKDQLNIKGFKNAIDIIEQIYQLLLNINCGAFAEYPQNIKAYNFIPLSGTQSGMWNMSWRQIIRLVN